MSGRFERSYSLFYVVYIILFRISYLKLLMSVFMVLF
ncbi:unnamed protein product [Brassica rapa subsp. trilocularis]